MGVGLNGKKFMLLSTAFWLLLVWMVYSCSRLQGAEYGPLDWVPSSHCAPKPFPLAFSTVPSAASSGRGGISQFEHLVPFGHTLLFAVSVALALGEAWIHGGICYARFGFSLVARTARRFCGTFLGFTLGWTFAVVSSSNSTAQPERPESETDASGVAGGPARLSRGLKDVRPSDNCGAPSARLVHVPWCRAFVARVFPSVIFRHFCACFCYSGTCVILVIPPCPSHIFLWLRVLCWGAIPLRRQFCLPFPTPPQRCQNCGGNR